MALELEEAPEPENQGRTMAEPASGSVHWVICKDDDLKWWRNPDFAAALKVQRGLGKCEATFHFYTHYPRYKRTYIHEVERLHP